MLAIILPALVVATLMLLTLAISYISLELLLRATAKGLDLKPDGLKPPVYNSVARQPIIGGNAVETRLQAAWQRF